MVQALLCPGSGLHTRAGNRALFESHNYVDEFSVNTSLKCIGCSLLLFFLQICTFAAVAAADDTEDLKLAMARLEANISRCRPQGVQIWFQRLKLLANSELHGDTVISLIERYQPRVQAVENDDKKISRMLATLDLVSIRKQLDDSCDLSKQQAALASLESSFRSLDLSSNCLDSPRVNSIRDLIDTGRKAFEISKERQRRQRDLLEQHQTEWDKVINQAKTILADPSSVKQSQANQIIRALDDITVTAQSENDSNSAECAEESPVKPYEKSALELRTKLSALAFENAKPTIVERADPADLSVPSVVSLPLEKAKDVLEKAGLVPALRGGETAPEESKTLHVQLQRPAAGMPVPEDKKVTIIVYSPPNPPLIVPKVLGADVKAANEMLSSMGFNVIVEGDSKAVGAVVSSQRPGAGQYLPVGSEIRLQTKKQAASTDETSFSN